MMVSWSQLENQKTDKILSLEILSVSTLKSQVESKQNISDSLNVGNRRSFPNKTAEKISCSNLFLL